MASSDSSLVVEIKQVDTTSSSFVSTALFPVSTKLFSVKSKTVDSGASNSFDINADMFLSPQIIQDHAFASTLTPKRTRASTKGMYKKKQNMKSKLIIRAIRLTT